MRAAFSLYISATDTEEILLQPIQKAIFGLFTNIAIFAHKYFTEEQRQIASVPEQEQIWLLLSNSNN